MHTQRSTRNLLIFGKTQPEHTEQLTLLNQENIGMAERDLVITIVEKEAEYKKYNVMPGQFT
jgi:hypothetical protein